MSKEEIRLEVGKFFKEEVKIGLQVVLTRYHRVYAKDEAYKTRKVFLSEQLCVSHSGEITVSTKCDVEIERFSRKVFSEISEGEYTQKKKDILERLNDRLLKL